MKAVEDVGRVTVPQTRGQRYLWIAGNLLLLLAIDILIIGLWRYCAASPDSHVGFITSESGILEVGQALLLAVSAGMCIYLSLTARGSSLGRHLSFGLGLFFVMLLLRELEIDKMGVSPNWTILENVLRAAAAVAAVIYCFYIIPLLPHAIGKFRALLRSEVFLLLVLGVAFYCMGWPFDKGMVAVGQGLALLMEEILEFNACFAFCAVANAVGNSSDGVLFT